MGNQIGEAINKTMIKNQNNYIQINGRILSQNAIKLLNPKQLSTIETILEKAIPNQVMLE